VGAVGAAGELKALRLAESRDQGGGWPRGVGPGEMSRKMGGSSATRLLMVLAAVGLALQGAEALKNSQGMKPPRGLSIHGASKGENLRAVAAEDLRTSNKKGQSSLEDRSQLIIRTNQGFANSVSKELAQKLPGRFFNYLPDDAFVILLDHTEVRTLIHPRTCPWLAACRHLLSNSLCLSADFSCPGH